MIQKVHPWKLEYYGYSRRVKLPPVINNGKELMMKKFLSFLLILLMVSCCGCSKSPQKLTVSVYGGETEINHYEGIEKGFLLALEANGLRDYQLVDSSELTTELLENREGITIIERCIGMAINAEAGDGVILNSPSNCGWYIACPTDGCYTPYKVGDYQMRDGTVFLSYMVYNPDNNYIDDIMERYDFILDRGLEVGGMYEFRHINGHIEVFLDGEFQFSADTMQEAYCELKAG